MKKTSLFTAVFLAGAISLTGCTTNPYTGESQASKTGTGAAIGAGVGAIIGLATGSDAKSRKKRALAGAGIGALGGAGVGAYMDKQEAKLREQLAGTGVSVTRNGDEIILNMPGNITFDTDSFEVQRNFMPVLESVSLVLKEYKSTIIHVGGHTDSTGRLEYNMTLSQRRAQSVGSVLRQFGVEDVRLDLAGYGPNHPIASNDTPAGRSQNRRVELILIPYTE
ncbi:MAG TPA: OmpA family protein [Alcanivoracaceae bacterium]|nr:OmpA family protein [Alcanivoracaceae bacterium]